MPLGDGLARILEGGVPVDAVGVAGDVFAQSHVTAVDVHRWRCGRRRRRRRVAESGEDDQDDGVLPAVDADVQLEDLVELDGDGVVDRRRFAFFEDTPTFVDEQHPRHQFEFGVFHCNFNFRFVIQLQLSFHSF